MAKYLLKPFKNGYYKGVIACSKYENLYNIMQNLQEEPYIKETEGSLLFQKENHYYSCFYSYGRILPSSIGEVEPLPYYKNIFSEISEN